MKFFFLKSISLIFLLVELILCDINLNHRYNPTSRSSYSTIKGVIGVMVEFQKENEDDPLTSGDGTFLQELNLGYIEHDEILRCTPEGSNKSFIVDPPPHNYQYFLDQLEAVKNYYENISNINFQTKVIDQVFQLSKPMREYAYSDEDITRLYVEAIELAEDEILANIEVGWNSGEFLIVVFHAGLEQSVATNFFDPTIYDIHSAYIEQDMLNSIGQSEILIGDGNLEFSIIDGILMPETLNMIYYDVIEDIFPVFLLEPEDLENHYCDVQAGITGLFAYWLGYRLGFDVMHNTENIQPITRIGTFALMDQGGYNNGRGVIPAAPVAWSRIKHPDITTDLEDLTNQLFSQNLEKSIPIKSTTEDVIYKIRITEDEYFLVENRNNFVESNILDQEYSKSIDYFWGYLNCDTEYAGCDESIQNDLKQKFQGISNYSWFNVLYELFKNDANYNVATSGVITKFPNYDYGLPGSGILIWHIQEPNPNDVGINNDVNNKAIHLEEGDGIVNLGYVDPDIFGSCLDTGCDYDFWFSGNEAYEVLNDIEQNENYFFNSTSIPNSDSYSGVESNISIEIISGISDNMTVKIMLEPTNVNIIEDINENDSFRIIGNDGNRVYYKKNNDYYSNDLEGNIEDFPALGIHEEHSDPVCIDFSNIDSENIILFYEGKYCILSGNDYYIDLNGEVMQDIPDIIGYINQTNIEDEAPEEIYLPLRIKALGDIDLDGLDEIIFNKGNTLYVYNEDIHGVSSTGFPIYTKFYGILVADVIGDESPEIIGNTDSEIIILSNTGEILDKYLLYDNQIFLIHSNSSTYLVNENHYIKFSKYNEDAAYWLNPLSTPSNYPLVGVGIEKRLELFNATSSNNNFGIDLTKAFNYPNPFEDDGTTFRFYVGSSNSVRIKIYDVLGYLVDDLSKENLINNEFSEYVYDTSKLAPGVYIAELKSDKNESKIIKLLKTK